MSQGDDSAEVSGSAATMPRMIRTITGAASRCCGVDSVICDDDRSAVHTSSLISACARPIARTEPLWISEIVAVPCGEDSEDMFCIRMSMVKGERAWHHLAGTGCVTVVAEEMCGCDGTELPSGASPG